MSFTADLNKYAEKTKSSIGTAKRAIVFNVFRQVIRKTPVDTGRAKGNWFVTENMPSPQISTRDDHSPLGSMDAASEGVLAIVTDKMTVDILTNNLEYIGKLEMGGSGQAPAGMMRTTLREFTAIAKKQGWS